MKKITKLISLGLVLALVFSGCGNTGNNNNSGNNGNTNNGNTNNSNENNSGDNSSSNGTPVEADFAQKESDMFSNRDSETNYDNEIKITLTGESASCNSDNVTINGSYIIIKDEGTYTISGTLNDGMIIIDSEETDKPQLVLDNAIINHDTSAAIYILEADKVFITLADGSTNELSNGGNFYNETPEEINTVNGDTTNIDGTVFSKQDLTFNGSGSLTVTSPAGHGIVCKDDLVFTSGTYTITSSSHGIDANDSFRMKDASITVAAGKDGIHVENSDNAEKGFIYITSGTLSIEAEGDGISSGYYTQIEGGTIDILAGGGYENGQQHSSDNWGNMGGGMGGPGGMSAGNGSIVINGGDIFMYAKGDGLDANGIIEITDGYIVVTGPTQGDTAILDYDKTATITGGTFIGAGSTMMAQIFSDGSQGTMAAQGSFSGGTEIRLEDADGKEIISYTPETSFQFILISSPDIIKGDSYTMYVGTASGTFEAY